MEIAARSGALLPKQLVRLRRTLTTEDQLELVSSHSTIHKHVELHHPSATVSQCAHKVVCELLDCTIQGSST